MVVRYSLFNIGSAAALNVRVQEAGFGAGDFDIVAGKADFTLDRLAPGANASHTLVVRPLKYGYYNFTAATVSYMESETATEVRAGQRLGVGWRTPGWCLVNPGDVLLRCYVVSM